MSMTAALVDAYANAPQDVVVLETLEIDHPAFDAPAYILCAGRETDIELPLTFGGEPVLFKYVPTQIVLPGESEDGPGPMQLRIANASRFLLEYLRAAAEGNQSISIVYRAYSDADLTRPGEVLRGYRLGKPSMTPEWVEATVGLREIELQAFPLFTYDDEYYPNLGET
jgi:hypothetical protein